VWRRERNEDLRRVLEARARQDQEWRGDLARRVDRMMERSEEEKIAEERRVKEAEREQLEEQKRNEEKRLEEKRREAEKKRKEDKKRREEEKKLEEERRRKRLKVVEAATAQAKKEKKEPAQ
jgi:hypothetical protein